MELDYRLFEELDSFLLDKNGIQWIEPHAIGISAKIANREISRKRYQVDVSLLQLI